MQKLMKNKSEISDIYYNRKNKVSQTQQHTFLSEQNVLSLQHNKNKILCHN